MRRHSFATVTSKGQITIPKGVREALCLKPGDRVVFEQEDGRIVLLSPLAALEKNFGSVSPIRRPEDFEEIRRKTQEWIASGGDRALD